MEQIRSKALPKFTLIFEVKKFVINLNTIFKIAIQNYSSFEACGKLCGFTRIPFGVTNAVCTFQRQVDQLVEDKGLVGTFPYLDNITVVHTREEHYENVNRLLRVLEEKLITLNEKKTISAVSTKINIFRYWEGNGIVSSDLERLLPLRELPVPENKRTLQRVSDYLHNVRSGFPTSLIAFIDIGKCKVFHWVKRN